VSKARRDRAWLLAPASESAQRDVTRDGDLCDADALLAGGWWAAATCQREARCFFDKNLYGAILFIILLLSETISFSVYLGASKLGGCLFSDVQIQASRQPWQPKT
jgi:hypothetical protein